MTDQTITLISLLLPIIGMMLKQSHDQNKVFIAQTAILKEHTALLRNILDHCDQNEKFHLTTGNLCRLADDTFKRGLVEDIAKEAV